MKHFKIKMFAACLLLLVGNSVSAQEQVESTGADDAKMAWWREAKFGMFVHWGVYAATGGEFRGKMPTNSAEWMMNKAKSTTQSSILVQDEKYICYLYSHRKRLFKQR